MSLTGITSMLRPDLEEFEVVSRDEKGFVTCRSLKVQKQKLRYLTNGGYYDFPFPSSWSCDYCGGSQPGTIHRCVNCGAPR